MYYKVTVIISTILLLLGIGLGFIGLPMFVKHMIKKQMNLDPNVDGRKLWEKTPFPLIFKVYVFNVTNAEEIQNGEKPEVHEVGPFVFEEWKDKYNIEDNNEEDTVSFNMRNTFIFRADLGLSGEEIITMPHPLIQVLAISVKRQNSALLQVVARGLEDIFKPQSAFVTATFMDIFYRGIDIHCNATTAAATAVCLNFQSGSVKGAQKINEQLFKFSLMGASNHSDAGRFKVSRGIKDNKRLGAVLEYNEVKKLNIWTGDKCNQLHGTDGTIFAPLMKPTDGLWSFAADLCRSMTPTFKEQIVYNKLKAYRYTLDFGDVQNEAENHCYCKSHPDNCPAKGTMDLSACSGTPMIASLPHFLHGDAKLIEAVAGLKPEVQKHNFVLDFELLTGTVLSVNKRLQYSLDVEPIAELPVMSNLRKLVMPFFWVEETIQLPEVVTEVLRKKIFLPLQINNAFKWLSTVFGGFGLIFGIFMLLQKRVDLNRVTNN